MTSTNGILTFGKVKTDTVYYHEDDRDFSVFSPIYTHINAGMDRMLVGFHAKLYHPKADIAWDFNFTLADLEVSWEHYHEVTDITSLAELALLGVL